MGRRPRHRDHGWVGDGWRGRRRGCSWFVCGGSRRVRGQQHPDRGHVRLLFFFMVATGQVAHLRRLPASYWTLSRSQRAAVARASRRGREPQDADLHHAAVEYVGWLYAPRPLERIQLWVMAGWVVLAGALVVVWLVLGDGTRAGGAAAFGGLPAMWLATILLRRRRAWKVLSRL